MGPPGGPGELGEPGSPGDDGAPGKVGPQVCVIILKWKDFPKTLSQNQFTLVSAFLWSLVDSLYDVVKDNNQLIREVRGLILQDIFEYS